METFLLMPRQRAKIKSPITDINNHLNKVLSSFNSLNSKLQPGFCLVDTFSDQFSFTLVNHKDTDALKTHNIKLDKIYEDSSDNQNIILIIVDMSIKNNVAMSVFHIQKSHNIIRKSVHHAMNVNSTEAELFAIRYRIDQATKIHNASKIFIITDTIQLQNEYLTLQFTLINFI